MSAVRWGGNGGEALICALAELTGQRGRETPGSPGQGQHHDDTVGAEKGNINHFRVCILRYVVTETSFKRVTVIILNKAEE